jgi:hypothetical protein
MTSIYDEAFQQMKDKHPGASIISALVSFKGQDRYFTSVMVDNHCLKNAIDEMCKSIMIAFDIQPVEGGMG